MAVEGVSTYGATDMLVVLFGPPGVGKSSLVTEAKSKGYEAYDLEHVERQCREAAAREVYRNAEGVEKPVVVGAAGTQPKHWGRKTITVLLLPPEPIYEERRAFRDELKPWKARQPRVYDAFAISRREFDLVLEHWSCIEEIVWRAGLI